MNEEKNITEHREIKSKNSLRAIIAIIIFSAIIVSSAIILASWGNHKKSDSENVVVADTTLNNNLVISSGKNKKSFPVSFSNNGIIDIKKSSRGVFVLTKDMISCIKENGSHVFSSVLNYASPVLKSNGKYGIVYDKLSGKYTIMNGKKILLSKSTEDDSMIITACISASGNYAISSNGDNAASILSYYNKNGTLLYRWACTKDHIVAVDISDNKKNILCAALNAENGEIVTKVYLLNIGMDETEYETSLDGTSAIDCFFNSSGKGIIICNNKRVLLSFNSKKNPVVCDYAAPILKYSSDDSGNSVVVTSKYGTFDSYEVTFYNGNNSVIGTYSTDKKIIDIKCAGKKAFLLHKSSVVSASPSGKDKTKIEFENVELGLEVVNSSIYHFSLGYLFKN